MLARLGIEAESLNRLVMKLVISSIAVILATLATSFGQAPDVPVYREGPGSHPQAATKKSLRKLRQENALLPMKAVANQLTRTACELSQPAPATTKLATRDIWRKARAAHIRVGWYYLCKECDKWHLELSGGYAITQDCVATCGHVISVDEEAMKEGFLVAVDEDDQAIPVIEVLANSPATDSAILRLKTDKLQPLALSRDVVPGDPVYCFSDPLDRRGVFTNGIVNRFMQRPFLRHEELTPEQKAHPDQVPVPVFIQVSTDWAPGSSGSAVLDQCGNAMGHVSEVQTELDDSGDDLLPIAPEPQPSGPENKAEPETIGQIPGTVIVFHDAIAASNVRALIKPKVPAP